MLLFVFTCHSMFACVVCYFAKINVFHFISFTSPASASAQLPHPGNYSRCTARFSGAPGESVDTFIDAIEAFRECTDIGEENCLRGLSMLLTHDAATWWQGVKTSIHSWDAAFAGLRNAFGDTRPPYKIYRQLFATPQDAEKTEIFVAKARSLLARIPRGDLCFYRGRIRHGVRFIASAYKKAPSTRRVLHL